MNWWLPKYPSRTVSVPATLFLSSCVTFGLALFSSTLALATWAFFTTTFSFFFSLLVLIPSCLNPNRPNPPLPFQNTNHPSCLLNSFSPRCSALTAYFHATPSWFPRPLVYSPYHPLFFLLIRLSLALVPLIPEGFVYLCWSCFYSLRLTPPIFSPVIWTAGLLCSYSTN